MRATVNGGSNAEAGALAVGVRLLFGECKSAGIMSVQRTGPATTCAKSSSFTVDHTSDGDGSWAVVRVVHRTTAVPSELVQVMSLGGR
jgi:hypothetical protein